MVKARRLYWLMRLRLRAKEACAGCMLMKIRHIVPLLLSSLLLIGAAHRVEAALLDAWHAADLSLLDDGDTVGSWTSSSNRMSSPLSTATNTARTAGMRTTISPVRNTRFRLSAIQL